MQIVRRDVMSMKPLLEEIVAAKRRLGTSHSSRNEDDTNIGTPKRRTLP